MHGLSLLLGSVLGPPPCRDCRFWTLRRKGDDYGPCSVTQKIRHKNDKCGKGQWKGKQKGEDDG